MESGVDVHLHIRLCASCVPGAHGDQKRASDPPEPELQMGVSLHGCWESNPGPLEEQPVLVTSETSLQAPDVYLFIDKFRQNDTETAESVTCPRPPMCIVKQEDEGLELKRL
ncbi:hypothetical protein STEG23_021032 [Scotinomys teguina]